MQYYTNKQIGKYRIEQVYLKLVLYTYVFASQLCCQFSGGIILQFLYGDQSVQHTVLAYMCIRLQRHVVELCGTTLCNCACVDYQNASRVKLVTIHLRTIETTCDCYTWRYVLDSDFSNSPPVLEAYEFTSFIFWRRISQNANLYIYICIYIY